MFAKKIAAAFICAVMLFISTASPFADTVHGAGLNAVVGASLSLSGDIGVNFYLDLQDRSAFDKVVISGPNGEQSFPSDSLSPISSGDNKGLYKLTYCVDPTQIGYNITLRLLSGSSAVSVCDSSGTAFGSDSVVFSARKYIDTIKRNSNASTQLSAAVNSLDVYCAYSASLIRNAPSPGYDAILPDITADSISKYKLIQQGVLPDDITILGLSLLIDSKTSLRIYLSGDPGTVEIDGSKTTVGHKDGKYYIEVPGLSAHDLDKPITAAIGYSRLKFYPLSYVYSVLKNEKDKNSKLCKLAKAIYAYSFAANMYFESSSGSEPATIENISINKVSGANGSYKFDYHGESFSAGFSSGNGGNWKIVDSYKITNRADMIIICEALMRINKVRGCITEYRTAHDMADEWEIHNQGYELVKEFKQFSSYSARLKDVDLDRKDQGKTFTDFAAELF